MKILIATGIFKPELGGPATYAVELAKRLQATGHTVTVLTFSDKPRYELDNELSFKIIRVVRAKNKQVNFLKFLRILYPEMKNNQIIYALDWFTVGLPMFVASKLTGKKYIVRVGGAYIWEKYLAQRNPPITLKEFYTQHLYRKYPLMFWIITRALRNAERVIFNSDEQRLIYTEVYTLHPDKTLTIYNAVPENRLSTLVQSFNTQDEHKDKEIVFAGRFITMKNIESLIEAFSQLKDEEFKLLLIGEGPLEETLRSKVKDKALESKVQFLPAMSQSELYKRIAHCYFVVIPSWTDVSPNQAYECLALGIPFLITQENYLSINKQPFLKIDPRSVTNIANTMNRLLDPKEYEKFTKELRALHFKHNWNDVVGEHLKVFIAVSKLDITQQ
jgi:glycosyltransferase involved in cell wall biosynthesis